LVAIELVRVGVRYADAAVLTDVTATAGSGSLVALCGPNGAGKTTLLRLLLGLRRPTSGVVRVFGLDPCRSPAVRRRVGYLPQASRLDVGFPLSVRDLVGLGTLRESGVWPTIPFSPRNPVGSLGRQVDEALALVDLAHLASRPVSQLSGGQMQLALLARALVGRPDMLLLDEPLAGLDQQRQSAFYPWLQRWRRRLGLTVVVVCHELQAICAKVDTLWCLDGGRLHEHQHPGPAPAPSGEVAAAAGGVACLVEGALTPASALSPAPSLSPESAGGSRC
jgi:ABC-type Mn2+/Zn2+ transport system ATPase subunit